VQVESPKLIVKNGIAVTMMNVMVDGKPYELAGV
jgi:hypothetical protein